ncbi:SGNH/GDSL hydrolase family protein [Streptomyces sp. NBC_01728]|uniref:SGNH/GDSL hydrolase family protein n=1 Tax=unclassified Streptomyces TaxID=2593676 RepID=UPI00225552E8|nr:MULTISPECIES: SGNH/GDSL hydrolase family protein [unclassified Streptomyces]MCX4459382.1 SGNH/GDSL hydrolase family protein [Streptomyces sp. NBC_01719]MCX4498739.1 SGNH/GDSL hydrolase family protein [Streptomyces sp. NBC_01728]
MRRPWIVGVLLAGLLLGACGDPASGPEQSPPDPALPTAARSPTTTTRQRPATSPTASTPANALAKAAPTVVYLGDSLAMESQKVLGQSLREKVNARYTSAPYSGTTLCDYLEGTGKRSLVPPADKAAALVRSLRPDFVVLQFWGNSWGYTPCMDGVTYDKQPATYFKRYEADMKRLTEQIADAGGAQRPRIVWVTQGPDPITPDRVRTVNALYEARAAASHDLLADAGRTVSPATARYTWAQYLPCTAYEREHPSYCTEPDRDRTALHRDDDYLHFCLAPTTSTPKPCPVRSPGIVRITREITRVIADRFG